MKYFKCIKEPLKNCNNLYSTYSTISNYGVYGSYNGWYTINDNGFISYCPTIVGDFKPTPSFTLGWIYPTLEGDDSTILDRNNTPFKLDEVIEYLEPFELVYDEYVSRLIEKKQGDYIKITPIISSEGYTMYSVKITTKTKNGKFISWCSSGDDLYTLLISCYKGLRNEYYRRYLSLIHFKR